MICCPVILNVGMRYGWAVFVAFLASALTVPATASAGVFSVNPTRIELSKEAPSAVLQVVNGGDQDTTVQLHMLQWSQIDGEDHYKTSRDLVSTPPIFNLRAGSTQLVRIGLPRKIEHAKEAAYRLILEEIPPPPEPGFLGLQVALKVSIPVFVKPDMLSRPKQDLDIALEKIDAAAPEKIRLNLENRGLVHVQLLGMKIFTGDGSEKLLASYEKNTYLLTGQKKILAISLKERIAPEGIVIRANTRSGMVEFHAKPGSP